MAKFIEVKMVGKMYREVKDDEKIYHLPDYKEFFGVCVKPVVAKINLDCICDAYIAELPVAHLHKRLVVRNGLFSWLFIREEETELRLEEDGTYKACALLLAFANRTEVIYVAPETYDMLETLKEKSNG